MSIESSELAVMSGKPENQPMLAGASEPVVDYEVVPPSGFGTTLCKWTLIIFSGMLLFITFPFCLFFILKVIPQYERAVIFRLGRIKGGREQGPGLFFIIPCIDNVTRVDTRLKTFDVPPQRILSKDSVTVNVDAIVNFRIVDPVMSVVKITNADWATRLLAQTTLRNILGSHKLSELLECRESIQQQLRQQLDEGTDPWGVKVETVAIKDVRIPQELQRSMAAEAEANREAKAKVIAAVGEVNAARALKEAAESIASSPTAMQLRYLQTLNIIAAERGSTIIFPIPIDMMGPMGQMMQQAQQGFPPVHTVAEAVRTEI
uniref:Mechanosensory family member n=1 Tax=Suberites domuncula TaxID=55567 RepID=U3UBT1_SUBDO|nr:mechanosensory family member [Suberites domuncula]